jgi:hypothetical protein
MRTDIPRSLKAVRVIDCGEIGYRGDRADAGDRHQPSAGGIGTDRGQHHPMKHRALLPERHARHKHRLYHRREARLVFEQLQDALLERGLGDAAGELPAAVNGYRSFRRSGHLKFPSGMNDTEESQGLDFVLQSGLSVVRVFGTTG